MKTIIKSILLILVTGIIFSGCDPQEESHSLDNPPSADQLSFSTTEVDGNPNIIEFKNTSSVKGIAVWDAGNGTGTVRAESLKATYPYAGNYTVTLTLYTAGGSTSFSKTIPIDKDDLSLLDTPMYRALTGGPSNTEGKTWVFDQYNAGHFGVYPDDNSWSWYAGANEKDGCSLYTQEFTFIQDGLKMIWKNNGSVYTNAKGVEELAKLGYTEAHLTPVNDYDVKYQPAPSYTFTLNEADMTITLGNGAFFGHYAGTSLYKIVKLEDDVMEVHCKSTIESGNNWAYRFIPKEKNIKPEIPLKAVPLSEDFESEEPEVVFEAQDMGKFYSQYYQNPLPLPVNTSARVCLYEKSSAFYTNLSYTVSGYKFDLTEVNKVRMKVLIPSGNDYETEHEVAGEWIANKKLLPQVEVKLQDSGKGDSAWENQTTIVKGNLEMDKWLELEFDFSSVKDRTDYDKIVIQFGAEGHAAPGIFYFDDFSFDK